MVCPPTRCVALIYEFGRSPCRVLKPLLDLCSLHPIRESLCVKNLMACNSRYRIDWEQGCALVRFAVLTPSLVLQSHFVRRVDIIFCVCWVSWISDHSGRGQKCPEEILVCTLGSMYVGLGFLGLLAVGKTSMMGRWELLHAGIFGALWAFLGILLFGQASLWYGLSAWVSSVCGLWSFWAFCSTGGMESLGCMTLLKAFWVLNGTFDICSCLTQSGKCSSEKTVRTSCAVSAALRSSSQWWVTRIALVRIVIKIKSHLLFFLNMTHRIDLFAKKKAMTQRNEAFLSISLKELNLLTIKFQKKLNFFFEVWLKELNLFFTTHRIEPFFFEYDAETWTLFFLHLTQITEPFFFQIWLELDFLMSRRIEPF